MSLVLHFILRISCSMAKLIVFPIKAFKDNYIWTIMEPETKEVWVADPGDALPVFTYLEENSLLLRGVIITHHHADHCGGVLELLNRYNIPVIGPEHPNISATQKVYGNEILNILDYDFSVIAIPGHTLEHVAYYSNSLGILFCGDTLFSAGCGRAFEGTYEQMYHSLISIKALPDNTEIYCAHEYTQDNLKFAKHLEPDNTDIEIRVKEVNQLIKKGAPSLPTTIGLEKKINPFIRCDELSIIMAVEQHVGYKMKSPQEIFQEIRIWKNNFINN